MIRSSHDSAEKLTVEMPAKRYDKGVLESKNIFLAREVPYTLFVNDREILSMATLPSNLRELFVGFMVSEGVLLSPSEVLECVIDHPNRLARMELDVPEERLEKLERKGMLTSGCAGGLVFSVAAGSSPRDQTRPVLSLPASTVLERMRELDTFHGIYSITRGVHAASVATMDETLVILEDLGRHNAVDKIVGHCFLDRIDTRDKLLLTTGRITSEVLTKASGSNFPIVISRSSASAMAVGMAKQLHIDVITYVRAGRFNYLPHGATTIY
ncbi:MAG: formate dehydrogenase accessory sulfurtransferase FdhD [Desulfomonile tiedjei]|uniref:Formate dehydrogenase accessory sulfurtransferase FdhD n=1 Tax=Desulfomonile tiedjei TaxID=2358 RepID=A0A9D6V4X3_9BACT|nr:formate dehydrogenase accessory sulfurtransferase FdhD [Desulfomonile tiedjei]